MTQRYRLLLSIAFFALCPVVGFAQNSVKPPALADIMMPAIEEKMAETAPALPAALPAATEAPIPPLDPDKFPVLAKIKAQSKEANYDYLGQRLGLDAWLVSGPSVMQTIYVLPDNKGAIVGGSLVDAEGREIGSQLQEEFIQKNPARAEELIKTVQQKSPEANATAPKTASELIWSVLQDEAGQIIFGATNDAPILYALLDPYQKLTKDMWPQLLAKADTQEIRLHVLPLAATDMKTVKAMTQLLGEADKQAAWKTLISGQALTAPTGPANTDGVLGLKRNLDFIKALGLRDIPVFLYKPKSTDKVKILRGQPKDWNGFWQDITGMETSVPITDAVNENK